METYDREHLGTRLTFLANEATMIEWIELAIKAVGAIPGLSAFATNAAKKYAANRITRNLAALVFWHGGVRDPLGRIAEGIGTQGDIDEIGLVLRTTQDRVNEARMYLLDAVRNQIPQMFGVKLALRIDHVVNKKVGVGMLRHRIGYVVKERRLSTEYSQELVQEIESFNQAVAAAHAEIAVQLSGGPAQGAPKSEDGH